MALKAGIEINKVDLRNIQKKIRELEKYPGEAYKILKHEGEQTVGRIRQDAPVDTGRLRREVTISTLTNKEVVITSEAIDPRTGKDYAPVREYGLDGHAPQPYFRPNIDRFYVRILDRLKRKLKQLTTKK